MGHNFNNPRSHLLCELLGEFLNQVSQLAKICLALPNKFSLHKCLRQLFTFDVRLTTQLHSLNYARVTHAYNVLQILLYQENHHMKMLRRSQFLPFQPCCGPFQEFSLLYRQLQKYNCIQYQCNSSLIYVCILSCHTASYIITFILQER